MRFLVAARAAVDSVLHRLPARNRTVDLLQKRVANPLDRQEGDTFWIIAQRGSDTVADEDDAEARMRTLGEGNPRRRLCLQTSGAAATDPLAVRIDLDPSGPARPDP